VEILDPDGQRLPHFHVYDSYSPTLVALRARLKSLEEMTPPSRELEERVTALRVESMEEEARVREQLGERLREHCQTLEKTLVAVARLDILLAKARLATAMGACKPIVVGEITRLEGLFHPLVREASRAVGRDFQPVTITFGRETCLITGANMGGKTVILKGIALSQLLFQFGFYVPAAHAEIAPVEAVYLSVGDGQDASRGLSSFAAEILRVDGIVREVKEGREALVLLDEPARGTNPPEGVAIVNALVEIFSTYRTRTLITTHYSGIRVPCRKLRVKGFTRPAAGHLPVDKLHELMDYSLVEESRESVPREATRVAELLGVDTEIIEKIKQYSMNDE
jgi:DNA mismatch repair ATPase MutS